MQQEGFCKTMTDIATLHIDFETRSELDLREVGLWKYVRHPSTDVWCAAVAIGDEEPGIATLTDRLWIPPRFVDHVRSGKPVYAHNAPFELAVWNEIMVKRYGWPPLAPEQTFCTMAACYAMGLPGALPSVSFSTDSPSASAASSSAPGNPIA